MSKAQAEKNIRGVRSAWGTFQSLIHGQFPGSARGIDSFTKIAGKKWRYK